MNEFSLPNCFWADPVTTACYVMNRVLIRPILKKTLYELLNGRKPNVGHLKVFGCKCYILNNGKEGLGKFDAKSDKGIFLGYSLSSHAYRVYNKKLMTVEESIYVVFDETNKSEQGLAKINIKEDEQNIFLKNLDNNTEIQPVNSEKQPIENLQQDDLPKEWRIPRDLSVDNIIGQINKGVSTNGRSAFMLMKLALMVAEAYERGVQGSPKRCGLFEGACNVGNVRGSASSLGR